MPGFDPGYWLIIFVANVVPEYMHWQSMAASPVHAAVVESATVVVAWPPFKETTPMVRSAATFMTATRSEVRR